MTDASAPTQGDIPRKARATKAASAVRDTASKAVDGAGTAARDLTDKTAAGIKANPLAVLAGGIALGVLAGAFAPRSVQEAKLLAPVGTRLSDTARRAIEAAKGTAKSEFDVLGFTRNAARAQIGKMLGDVVKALTAAATAALSAAKTVEHIAAAPLPAPKDPSAKKPTPHA